ncbi:MAG: ABC transporter ATP-binding protein [Synechococcaceae cyanobacterium SM2_3_1]|nr:ABC transporter ATP-binding protein [Synechococcaceae cyanobacterium SM2_3_1]
MNQAPLPLLTTTDLGGGYQQKRIIQGLDLELQQGEWMSCVGPNGSGKSTLLRLISRILPLQQGRVLLEGQAIHEQPPREVARKLAILPQQQQLPKGLTVRQLVSLGRSPYQPWWRWELLPEDHDKVTEALLRVQMEYFADQPVERLSGGERQRAFLALALAQDPKLLLLDEPTTYLDLRYQLELLELLKHLNQEQALTIVTVLHDLNLAARYSHRVTLLHQGQIWAVGSPKEVLTPEHLRNVFGIDVALITTPVGLQICPLASTQVFPVSPVNV